MVYKVPGFAGFRKKRILTLIQPAFNLRLEGSLHLMKVDGKQKSRVVCKVRKACI